MAYIFSRTMCSTPVVYLVSCVGPSWALYPCTSAESPSYHAVSCNMQTGSFVSPLHFQLTKCYQAQICICSVLKDGRVFLGTLALDSNCIVWCTCCGEFALCALKLHIHPVDDCSFPFSLIALHYALTHSVSLSVCDPPHLLCLLYCFMEYKFSSHPVA